MKLISLILALFLFFLTRAFGGNDWPANHCELFVEQVTKAEGIDKNRILVFLLRTKNERLDSAISEVGLFYNGAERELARRINNNYFVIELPGTKEYRGSFYVKTDQGTTLWVNSARGDDFLIDRYTFESLASENFNPHYCR